MSFHVERLQELMAREIAAFLQEDDVIQYAHGLVTVSRIEMDSSAQHAKVFLRIYPETEAVKILLHLHEIAPDVRFTLGRRIALKSIPRLNFFLDVEEEGQT